VLDACDLRERGVELRAARIFVVEAVRERLERRAQDGERRAQASGEGDVEIARAVSELIARRSLRAVHCVAGLEWEALSTLCVGTNARSLDASEVSSGSFFAGSPFAGESAA